MANLIKTVEIAKHTIGPLSFFQAVREDQTLERMPGQDYWSWPQWDRFFELAEEHGMNACQQHDAGGRGTVTTLHFKALGTAILMDWRRVRAAQESGQSSYGFHLQEERRRVDDKRRQEEFERFQHNRVVGERAADLTRKPSTKVNY